MEKRAWRIVLAVILLCALALLGACAKDGDQDDGKNTDVPASAGAESIVPVPSYDTRLDEAFAGNKTLRLVPGEMLSGETAEQLLKLISISPDGKTLLAVQHADEDPFRLCMIRDGVITPVRRAEEKGVGDPNGTFDFYAVRLFPGLPGPGGISWSADGRYASFDHLSYAISGILQSTDVPVLDTASGELWLADSFQSLKASEKGSYEAVVLCSVNRNGDYLYYLTYGDAAFRFCRCAPDGSRKEILYEIPRTDDRPFDISSASVMLEDRDGNWLILGNNMSPDNRENRLFMSLSLLRLSPPAGDTGFWNAKVFPLGNIHPNWLLPSKFGFSPVSGYGLCSLINNTDSVSDSGTGEIILDAYISVVAYTSHVNLLRIRPGDDYPCDVWYLADNAESPAGVEFVSGEEFLRYIQAKVLYLDPAVPEGFDPKEYMYHPAPNITNFCLSPDGRYALIHVSRERSSEDEKPYYMYLVKLDNMAVLPVAIPENIGGRSLFANTVFSGNFLQGMLWNSDGTLLVLDNDNEIVTMRLEVE